MTKKRTYPLIAAALCAAMPAAAQARSPVPVSHPAPGQRLKWDSRKFMSVSELRPGMRGYALTVFKGTKIEKFHVEILGVIAKFNMGKDYILFRALDGPSVTRQLNIAHGMSGSPIYINGRLVGAISMGIPGTQFPKDPIALATPIEDMFDAWSPDLPSHVGSISATDSASAAPLDSMGVKASAFSQIDIPVSVSGVNRSGMDWLSQRLAPYHFAVMSGGGAGTANNPLAKNPTLVPGSAVGVSLVQGDVDVTATGTVTYRDGNRLLLFGHPLADLGPLDAALTTAYVVDIFPSYQDSIKLGAPIETVGRIFQDRPFSVGGIIGSMPSMIPVTVDVNDESIKRRKVVRARVINHPLLSEQLITLVADQAISQLHGEPGDSQAVVKLDLDVEELGHITRTNTFFDSQAIDQSAIGDLVTLMHLFSANPFYPLAVKSVKMSVTVQNRHDTAELDHIFLKQAKFAPGDTVDVGIVMKPFKREMVTNHVQVKIPANAPEGTFTISVKGGGTDTAASASGGIIIIRSSEPASAPAASVQQLTKRFLDKPRNDQFLVRLLLPTRAIDIRGEKLSNLPPNIASALQSSHSTGLVTERDDVRTTVTTPYVVTGSQEISFTVAQRDQSDTAAPSPATPPATKTGADGDGPDASTATTNAKPTLVNSVDVDAPDLTFAAGDAASPAKIEPLPVMAPPPAAGGGARILVPPVMPPAPGAKPADAPGAWKTVAHAASAWRQTTAADFATGTFEGVGVSSAGEVQPAPPIRKSADLPASYAWSVAPVQDGGVYVGTGDRGVIYKVAADGTAKQFFKTDGLEVTSLAVDSAGNVYAGVMPKGIVYKISPDGLGRQWFTASEPYITALKYDAPHDRLFVATGGGTGKVYAVSGAGIGTTWLTTGEGHILCLSLDDSGNLYAGTAGNGLVYQVSPSGVSHIFYDSPETQVTGLAAFGPDRVLVGTAPHGNIYRVDALGSAKKLTDNAVDSLAGLVTTPGGDTYGAAGNEVLRIGADDRIHVQTTEHDEQMLSLAWDAHYNELVTGTGTVASLYRLGSGSPSGNAARYVSSVLDAGDLATWGTISWNSGLPADPSVSIRTRAGDTPHPDSSWSAWSSSYTNSAGQRITSPQGRYLQYEAVFRPQSPDATLHNVSVYYRTQNRAPSIKVTTPGDGDAVSKTVTVQWAATDPDHDVLSYDIASSSDGGKTWKPLKTRFRPTAAPAATDTVKPKPAGASAAGSAASTDAEVAARVAQMRKELALHPSQFPPAVRDQILAQAPEIAKATISPEAKPAAPAVPGETRDTTFSWDTSDLPDGVYALRITASDRPSNPGDPLSASATVAPIVVSNHAPAITLAGTTLGSDKRATVKGRAVSAAVYIKAVQFRIDGGDVYAAQPDDGLFDSLAESFTLVTPPLEKGKHQIEIQVVDRAGNIATTTSPVDIP